MTLTDYLDKGASLGRDAPCLVGAGWTLTYGEVQQHSHAVAAALARSGVAPGDKVGILSGNDVVAFATVFGIARRGAVWCPINPRNEAEETRQQLELCDCSCLLFQAAYAPLVDKIAGQLPKVTTLVCLDADIAGHPSMPEWLDGPNGESAAAPLVDDLALIVGTGGKGVMLTGRSIETMTASTLIGFPFPTPPPSSASNPRPFDGRPAYLALAPLTHAAGLLCCPVMAHGGRIVVLAKPDIGRFLELVEQYRVTHTFLPPTLIDKLLGHERLAATDLSSLQCFWYGAGPMSEARLEEAVTVIGPVLAQLFGQCEAPMVIAMMPPRDHFDADGSIATRRLSAAGRPGPLVTVAIMDGEGSLLPDGERGEIVVRSSLVMAGYYKDPAATAEASRFGWHHTGDIGFLDDEGFLHVVDRAKDMVSSGGSNVHSAMARP